jgi:predicted  nucleic acid-binding Zn-ribbon protein
MNDTVQKIMAQALAGVGYKCQDCGTKYAKIPSVRAGANPRCPKCGCTYFRQHPYDDPYTGINWDRPNE